MVFLGKEKKWDTVEGKQVETPLLGTLCKDSEWDQLVRRHKVPGAQEAKRGKRWAGPRRPQEDLGTTLLGGHWDLSPSFGGTCQR